MKNKVQSTLILSCLGLFAGTANAEVKLSLSTGIDTNPYRFSEAFKDDVALYFDNRLKYTYENDSGFFAGINLHSLSHNDAFDAANKKRHSFNLGYRYKFNKQHELKGMFRQGEYNKTYISRNTGQLAMVNGVSIADRYDFGWSDIKLDYNFKLNKKHKLYAGVDFQKKNYVDFTELGISDLDYDQLSIIGGWRFKPNKTVSTRLEFRSRTRDYVNKPNRDANGLIPVVVPDPNNGEGDQVDPSLLSYDYQRIIGSAKFKINDNHKLDVSLMSESRTDGFEGYYDTDNTRYNIEWHWQLDEESAIVNEIKNRVSESVTDLSEEEQEEEFSGFDFDGIVYTLSYLFDIWEQKDTKIDGYVSLIHSDYDAGQPSYIYDRQQIEIGVNIEL